MSKKPYERVVFNPLEKPYSKDFNQEQSNIDRALRATLEALLARRNSSFNDYQGLSDGFLSDGFQVRQAASPGMKVRIKQGVGFFNAPGTNTADISGIVGVDDLANIKPLILSADAEISTTAADPTNPRIDIVEVKVLRQYTDTDTRPVWNTGTEVFDPTSVQKTLSFALDGTATLNGSGAINYKTGTAAGSPTVPATTAGYIKIAEIYVAAAATSITDVNIVDYRIFSAPGGTFRVAVECTVASDTAVPEVKRVIGPPGTKAMVRQSVAGTYFVHVQCGKVTEATVQVTVAHSNTPTTIIVPQVTTSNANAQVTVNTLAAAPTSDFTNGTFYNPTATVNNGATALLTRVTLLKQSAGTTSAVVTGDFPMRLSFNFDVQV